MIELTNKVLKYFFGRFSCEASNNNITQAVSHSINININCKTFTFRPSLTTWFKLDRLFRNSNDKLMCSEGIWYNFYPNGIDDSYDRLYYSKFDVTFLPLETIMKIKGKVNLGKVNVAQPCNYYGTGNNFNITRKKIWVIPVLCRMAPNMRHRLWYSDSI